LEAKILIATILIAFVGIGGQSLFDTIWYRPQVQIIFWLLVAALSCVVSKKVIFAKNETNE
jgi:putative inorganic carbon (HCO3(-)) transporter